MRIERFGGRGEALVAGPESCARGEPYGSEQRCVDVADTDCVEFVTRYEAQHFLIFSDGSSGEFVQHLQDRFAGMKLAHGQFSDDPWMAQHIRVIEQSLHYGIALAQVVDPD